MMMMRSLSPQKALAGSLSALVLIVIGVGIYMAGSPATVRRQQLDQQRVNSLEAIANAVDQVYATDGKLPASVDELAARADSKRDVYLSGTVDPVTQQTYEYRALEDGKYELCATFEAEMPPGRDGRGIVRPIGSAAPIDYPGYQTWDHGVGRTCFTLDAAARGPVTTCSVTQPCTNPYHTCMTVPNRGSICVAQGHECEAAGCEPGACVIRESYPAQVSCTDGTGAVSPGEERQITCNLMKSKESGAMACFGCGSQICNKPGPEWEHYEMPEGEMGIPYSCYDDEEGKCALAQ